MYLILLILVNISYCFKENWYKTTFKGNSDDWIELRNLPTSLRSAPLSTIANVYAKRIIEFNFPFYEEMLDSTIATSNGFLNMGNGESGYLFQNQYIAPLMGGFAPPPPGYKDQDVRHFSNTTIYIHQWSDMSLQSQTDVGTFTFQVQLHCDGVIKFVYKEIPMPVSLINGTHATKVGISDAYNDGSRTQPQLIPYDVTEVDVSLINSDTTFVFTPQPTCASMKRCGSCIAHSEQCVWCSAIDRCSTREAQDRYHMLWNHHGCNNSAVQSCDGEPQYNHTVTDPPRQYCVRPVSDSSTFSSITNPRNTAAPPIISILSPEQDNNHVEKPDESNNNSNDHHDNQVPVSETKHSNWTGTDNMTIITTISITAVCITAILVISALLILKLRKPGLMMPIKLEEAKPCPENCTSTLLRQPPPPAGPPSQQNFPFADL